MPRDCTGTLAPNPTPKCEFVLDVQSPVASGDPMTTPKKTNVSHPNRSKGSNRNTKSQQHAPQRVTAAPVAVSSMQTYNQPTIVKSRRIKNSEFISDLFPSSNFTIQSYPINPGLALSFPWLSTQASNWQQYRFHSLRYRFVTRTSTAAGGSVILSPEYNSSDSPPKDERAAMNTMDSVEDVVWKELSTTLNVSAMFGLGPRKQIRSALIAGDLTVYDAGVMHAVLAYVNTPVNFSVGKLWVDYDVELFVPQTATSLGLRVSSKLLSGVVLASTVRSLNTWSICNLSYYPTVGYSYDYLDTLGVDLNVLVANDTLRIPQGTYLFQVWVSYQCWASPGNGSATNFRFREISSDSDIGQQTSTRSIPAELGGGVQLCSETISFFGTFHVTDTGPLINYFDYQLQNRQSAGADNGSGDYLVMNGGAFLITLL